MRLKINLASTPYENAGRFYVQWGLALAVLVAITALLAVAAARTWRVNHALTRSISEERARLDKLNDEERADLAILNEPQNRDVRERSLALNALIVRKSFSWTRIFNDLEKMMPSRLHVVSIAPQLTANNQLQIRMMVAGSSREKAIELVQNMEKAPDFHNAQIVAETANAAGTGARAHAADAVTFNIVAEYTPSATPQSKEAPAAASEKTGKAAAPGNTEKPKDNAPTAKKSNLVGENTHARQGGSR